MGRRKRSRRSDNLPLGDPATFENVNTISKQLLKKYEIDMSVRELSDGTIRNYLADLKQWMRYIYLYQENKSVKKIDEDEIVEADDITVDADEDFEIEKDFKGIDYSSKKVKISLYDDDGFSSSKEGI